MDTKRSIVVLILSIITFIDILGIVLLSMVESYYKHIGDFKKAKKYEDLSTLICVLGILLFLIGAIFIYILF